LTSEVEILKTLNEKISHLTSYGIRYEKAEKDNSTVLIWSNAGRKWLIFRKGVKAGETVMLDANMLLVPYDAETISKIIDQLDPLPLYFLSVEAKTRGEAPENATEIWLRKQLERKDESNGL